MLSVIEPQSIGAWPLRSGMLRSFVLKEDSRGCGTSMLSSPFPSGVAQHLNPVALVSGRAITSGLANPFSSPAAGPVGLGRESIPSLACNRSGS